MMNSQPEDDEITRRALRGDNVDQYLIHNKTDPNEFRLTDRDLMRNTEEHVDQQSNSARATRMGPFRRDHHHHQFPFLPYGDTKYGVVGGDFGGVLLNDESGGDPNVLMPGTTGHVERDLSASFNNMGDDSYDDEDDEYDTFTLPSGIGGDVIDTVSSSTSTGRGQVRIGREDFASKETGHRTSSLHHHHRHHHPYL